MGWAGKNTDAECPFINGTDHRCDHRLTLRRIDQAFNYCLGGYLACPTYQQLSWEAPLRESADDQSEPQAAGRQATSRLPAAAPPRGSQRFVGLTLRGQPANAAPRRSPVIGRIVG